MKSGNRHLLDEEASLWAVAVRDVPPLRGRKREPVAPKTVVPEPPSVSVPSPAPEKPRTPTPPLVGRFDETERRRLGRRDQSFDAKFDLHGYRHADGCDALRSFLERSRDRGARTVLVVTGKSDRNGTGATFQSHVPLWLALPEFSLIVSAFDTAHPRHGGEGALYVRIRRRRNTG